MDKISSEQAVSLLKTAASTIRTLVHERDGLQGEIFRFAKEARVRTLAGLMEEKGLHGDMTHEEKLAHLQDVPNLDVTEEAVKMASPQSPVFADLGDQPGGGNNAFETYILTGESPD